MIYIHMYAFQIVTGFLCKMGPQSPRPLYDLLSPANVLLSTDMPNATLSRLTALCVILLPVAILKFSEDSRPTFFAFFFFSKINLPAIKLAPTKAFVVVCLYHAWKDGK